MNDFPEHPDLRVIGHEIRFKRHLRVDVYRFRHRLFSGEWSGERIYDVIRRGAAVGVLLYDPDRDAVVLVEQFRLPPLLADYSPWVVEVVAGLVDRENETHEQVGLRETKEEAGVEVIGDLVPIQRYVPMPGNSDETISLFCGRMDSRKAGGIYGIADEHEDIRVVVKPLAELEAMVDAGQIDTGHTLICLYWLLRHRDTLRRKWGVAAA
jgi:ADP-ribose pyrophosphatase